MVGALLMVAALAVWQAGSPAPATQPALSPTPTLPPLPTLDQDEVALGRQVYAVHCAVCHGPDAEGAPEWKIPDEEGRYPPPPHDDSGHTWHHGDGLLYRIIRDGWPQPRQPDEPLTMPAFGDKLDDREIRAVIAYFKSLWSEENRLWQWEVSQTDPFPTVTPEGSGKEGHPAHHHDDDDDYDDDYDVMHSNRFMLIDRTGQIRHHEDGWELDAGQWIGRMRRLTQE